MPALLLLIPSLILFLSLFFTYKSLASYKNGILFAVSLPPHAIEHPQLQEIQKQYNKNFNLASTVQLISFVPLLFLAQLFAIQIIYFFLWIISVVLIMIIPFRKAFRATLQLKRQEQWFVGEKKIIRADLRAAQLKNKGAASPLLFIIPLGLSLLLTYWAGTQEEQLYGVGIAAIITTLLFLGVVIMQRRSRSIVYSENSEINIALNQHRRRLTTYQFFWLAIFENLHFYFLALLLLNDNEPMASLWLSVVIGFSLLPMLIIVLVYQRIGSMRREMLALDGNHIYSDDDEYWGNGFTYHNPFDKSVLVPKRVGIGETINTGTLTGKIIMGGVVGLLAVVIVGVSFLAVRSELSSPTLTINEQEEIAIQYPMYSYTFNLQDIQELTLVDSIPSGVKSNGEATSKYARGHFKLKELGKSRLYVYKNNPPYISLKLADQYIFYNDIDPAVTQKLYEQLQQQLQ